jgi:hypothetical protein
LGRKHTSIGVRLVRTALTLAPTTRNPAWRFGNVVRRELGDAARITIGPRQVIGKVSADRMQALKRRLLVQGLATLDVTPLPQLLTYRDIQDYAVHGEDYHSTRLYAWLKQSAEQGRPVNVRGVICDSEERILSHYFSYLDLFRSMQERGYCYRGDDEICFGVTADGRIVQMRRGTHRLATAHFLDVSTITGYVTHIDPAWIEAIGLPAKRDPIAAIAHSLRQFEVTP